MSLSNQEIELLKRLPQSSAALQKLYQLRLRSDREKVDAVPLEEKLLDIEEHVHAYYLNVQAHLRRSLPAQARQGLEKVLSGLRIQAELTLLLSKVEVPRSFPKRLRQADSAIQQGCALVQKQAC